MISKNNAPYSTILPTYMYFLTTITFLIQVSQYSQYFSRKKEHENDERSRKEEALRRQRSSVCISSISLLDNAPNFLPLGCVIQKRSFHYFKALLSFSKRKIRLKIFLNLANSCFKIQPILQSKKRN